MTLHALPYLAALILLGPVVWAARRPGMRPGALPRAAEAAAAVAVAVALAMLAVLLTAGPGTGALMPGFAARLDVVSVTMALLVAFVGWVVLRYSVRYLDGEPMQGAFTGRVAGLLAAILLLVTAGTLWQLVLAWIAVSLLLRKLLLTYPDRVGAQRAARKMQLATGAGDAALIVAAVLLALSFGTADIAAIAEAAKAGPAAPAALWAAGLIAVAAVLKSALIPLHGWLTEVMEAPTPVSALLHAGVINAGGFLMIRFADVMLAAPGVLAVVALIGGLSALVGGLVMLTQPAVKTALAWSTIAQMGFMVLQCGLALFPLALLHIVAHSLYKAHAFLGSGGAVGAVLATRRPGPVAVPSARAVARAFGIALAIYGAVGLAFGFDAKSPQAVALGAILILGVAYLIAQGLADAAPRELTRRTGVAALAAALGYFTLQRLAEAATHGTLPPAPTPGPLEWAVIWLAVLSFGAVAWAQAAFPLWSTHPAAAGLRVHLSNGLYANAVFDRLIRGWAAPEKS